MGQSMSATGNPWLSDHRITWGGWSQWRLRIRINKWDRVGTSKDSLGSADGNRQGGYGSQQLLGVLSLVVGHCDRWSSAHATEHQPTRISTREHPSSLTNHGSFMCHEHFVSWDTGCWVFFKVFGTVTTLYTSWHGHSQHLGTVKTTVLGAMLAW